MEKVISIFEYKQNISPDTTDNKTKTCNSAEILFSNNEFEYFLQFIDEKIYIFNSLINILPEIEYSTILPAYKNDITILENIKDLILLKQTENKNSITLSLENILFLSAKIFLTLSGQRNLTKYTKEKKSYYNMLKKFDKRLKDAITYIYDSDCDNSLYELMEYAKTLKKEDK